MLTSSIDVYDAFIFILFFILTFLILVSRMQRGMSLYTTTTTTTTTTTAAAAAALSTLVASGLNGISLQWCI